MLDAVRLASYVYIVILCCFDTLYHDFDHLAGTSLQVAYLREKLELFLVSSAPLKFDIFVAVVS